MATEVRSPISSDVSKAALNLLVQQGCTRADLASFMDRSESFVSLVLNKKRNLTIEDLENLEAATSIPIPILLVQSFKRKKNTPAYLREFYSAAEKALKCLHAEAPPTQSGGRNRRTRRRRKATKRFEPANA